MSGGILLALLGVWVGCQVLGGDALGRLGLIDSTATPAKQAAGTPAAKAAGAGAGASSIAKLSTLPAYAAKAI